MNNYTIIIIIYSIFQGLISCNVTTDNIDMNSTNHVPDYKNKNDSIQKPDYQVVSEDYVGGWLQRVFVQVSPEIIKDSLKINIIIDEISGSYDFDKKSSISFFKDSSYANYIEELLKDIDDDKKDSVYTYWKEEQYLGEYYFGDSILVLYPASE